MLVHLYLFPTWLKLEYPHRKIIRIGTVIAKLPIDIVVSKAALYRLADRYDLRLEVEHQHVYITETEASKLIALAALETTA